MSKKTMHHLDEAVKRQLIRLIRMLDEPIRRDIATAYLEDLIDDRGYMKFDAGAVNPIGNPLVITLITGAVEGYCDGDIASFAIRDANDPLINEFRAPLRHFTVAVNEAEKQAYAAED